MKTQTKHTPEAEATADPILKAAGSGLRRILDWREVAPCRPAGDKPSGFIEARTAIAKAIGQQLKAAA